MRIDYGDVLAGRDIVRVILPRYKLLEFFSFLVGRALAFSYSPAFHFTCICYELMV